MARIRTIKPEFFTSLTIADLTPVQRLTFIGLWTHVDDEGRCVDDPRLIKAALWPLDDRTAADVEDDLNVLHSMELLIRYMVDGKRFMSVKGWDEHQKINRPTRSKLPGPSDGTPLPPNSLRTHGAFTESSSGPQSAPSDGSSNPPADTPPVRQPPTSGQAAESACHWAEEDPLTSGGTPDGEADVNPHGALTEPSLPEGNREQGTGKGKNSSPKRGRGAASDQSRLDVERLCKHLADRIEARGSKRPSINKEWRDAARLLIDKDKRTEEQIHKAIDWCQDNKFWHRNILSMPTLREKYDRIRLDAIEEKAPQASNRPTNQHHESSAGDNLASVFG